MHHLIFEFWHVAGDKFKTHVSSSGTTVLDGTRVLGLFKTRAKEARAMTIVGVVRAAEEIRATFGVLLAVKGRFIVSLVW
jgi:hypothetical protein